ncbi:MAG: hypothetical protein OH363_06050 [Candidatus Parvarchaeota archaeon]|nr:hypothetical protein [Candidatus Jingweiarchaeum tengchongense]
MSGIFGISSTYTPLLLSHQTGLSVTASTANTFYAIGSVISVPRNGIVVISMSGHVSAGVGSIQLKLTRGSATYTFGQAYNPSSDLSSLFGQTGQYNGSNAIFTTSSSPLFVTGNFSNTGSSSNGSQYTSGASPSFILPVYSGDSLQFYATNDTANDITYVDDMLVMLI